ncbi:LysR substrate-binding domain-containing protein [Prescottella soli]|uniref:LysR substrate-binding domain-containing protein n=1 Tax=Prescottella soli TaxID=1543852 RepID=A0ABW9FYX0_9NOCA
MYVSPQALRCFLAVADELHFGRAAAQLHMTGPALSQQVSRLEKDLRFLLFERNSRHVELTEAGRALIPQARAVVAANESLLRWRESVREGRRSIDIGFMATGAGQLTTAVLDRLRSADPDLQVRLHHLEWSEQLAPLLAGNIDAVFVREPFPAEGVRRRRILSERRVAVLAHDHPLAARESIRFAEIAAEPFISSSGGPPEWTDFWMVNPRPDGTRAEPSLAVSTVEELLEAVAAGAGVTTTPESLPSYYRHPLVSFVPIEDISPSVVTLCTLEGNRRPELATLQDAIGEACRQVALEQPVE